MKIKKWDEKTAKKELSKRFLAAKEHRSNYEFSWAQSEQTVYSNRGESPAFGLNYNQESRFEIGAEDVDSSDVASNVSYAFRNFRFLHAQMSANPPSVVPRPTSPDPEDRRRASAADKCVKYGIRFYKMQELMDKASLHCLLYGTGITKTVWNSERGEIIAFDEETDEILLEGDMDFSSPSPWDLYIDPDAETVDGIRHLFHRITMPYEEALHRWPDKEELLQKARVKGARTATPEAGYRSFINDKKSDSVELYEYWETGLPINGYGGRFCICNYEGDQIEPLRSNPFKFVSFPAINKLKAKDLDDATFQDELDKLPQKARLPFHIFTDIDVPNTVWGKSFIEYVAHLQENINRLDRATLDNVAAHSASHLILPEGSELADDSITNSPWDILKISGNQPPHFMRPAQTMPDLHVLRDRFKMGVDDVSGINDSMFGSMKRETAGTALQYATNQGNLIRRRLFNKYAMFVESVFSGYLNLIRKHWDTSRVINVLGEENIMEAVSIKGADINGGYDVQAEYGASLSLDPTTRRDELMNLLPLFEKAGVPPRDIMGMMRLNEVDTAFDILNLAKNRQQEYYEQIIADRVILEPKEFEDHDNMIAHSLSYFMTEEFNNLDDEVQELCRQHLRLRIEMGASEKAATAPAPVPPGAPPGVPPGLPIG